MILKCSNLVYRKWPWDTLEVVLFWGSKIKVTGSITLHNNTSFPTSIAFFTFARWRYHYYNVTTALRCHSLYSLGGDTDNSNTAWVRTQYILVLCRVFPWYTDSDWVDIYQAVVCLLSLAFFCWEISLGSRMHDVWYTRPLHGAAVIYREEELSWVFGCWSCQTVKRQMSSRSQWRCNKSDIATARHSDRFWWSPSASPAGCCCCCSWWRLQRRSSRLTDAAQVRPAAVGRLGRAARLTQPAGLRPEADGRKR